MRKIGFLIAVAILGMSVPMTAPARAEESKKIIIKTADSGGDRDRDHDRRWHRDRDHHKVVIVKKHHRDNDHD